MLVESVLSRQLDDLEPTLTRHSYRLKDKVDQFNVKPNEFRALFNNQLDLSCTVELRDSADMTMLVCCIVGTAKWIASRAYFILKPLQIRKTVAPELENLFNQLIPRKGLQLEIRKI